MILLLRHGQTEFNVARRIQGQVDSPLTDLGRAQAAHMAAQVAGLSAGRAVSIWSSPLGRAMATAQIIGAGQRPAVDPRPDPGLKEVSLGDWDGHSVEQIDRLWPGARADLPPEHWYFHGPGGERLPAVLDRVQAALARVAADPAPVRVIVSHGIAGRAIRMVHCGVALEDAAIHGLQQDAVLELAAGGRLIHHTPAGSRV